MKRTFIGAVIALSAALMAAPAAAYVGPGAGLSMLGALWGLLVAVVAALGFVLAWPLRRYLRKARAQTPDSPSQAQAGAHPGTADGEGVQGASADRSSGPR